mgnify:CR=1 FL=1
MNGYTLAVGPEVPQPPYTNWVRGSIEHFRWRLDWVAMVREAIQYHDAWALWCMKPDGDIEIRDVLTAGAVWEATNYGTVHLILGQETR